MTVADFVHLRVRSAYSLLEGAIKPYDLAALALAHDMPAVGLSDRANLFGALEISQILKDKGVQPLIGCALPVSGIGVRGEERWARAPTIALIAKSETGWLNLMALSSQAFVSPSLETEPCVAWDDVVARSEGLILLSGGPDGPINPLLISGREAEGFAALAQMQAAFGDRFYVELQRHGLAHEAAAEQGLVRYAYDCGAPLVATNDVYFSTAEMHSPHDALLCISDSAFLGQDERRRVSVEHRFKSAAQMREAFTDLPEACDNTMEIAKRCAFLVPKRDPILPRTPTA
jgi:DNA polymerase-3 subunit alpha